MKVNVTFQEERCTQKDLTVTKKLGCGKYAVFHVQGPAACEEYAVKVFPKSEVNEACYKKEKDFLASLSHPNIIRHFPVSKHDAEFDLLIMEYANHGDFFDLVTKGGLTHDVYIRTYFHQLIAGLEYLHQQKTAHLDLKLENLLLGQDFQLKIIDFEQSQSQGEERLTAKGTNSYRAPEIKKKTCTDKFAADIYSAGIVLYAFKACQFPFYEPEHEAEMEDYNLFVRHNSEFWKMKTQKMKKKADFFEKDFRDLLKGMLNPDPKKRWTIRDIKNSVWYNKPILGLESLNLHMEKACTEMNTRDLEQSPTTNPQKKEKSSSPLKKLFSFLKAKS